MIPGLGPAQAACIACGYWDLGLGLAGQDHPKSELGLPIPQALFWQRCEVKVMVRLMHGHMSKSRRVTLGKIVGRISSG